LRSITILAVTIAMLLAGRPVQARQASLLYGASANPEHCAIVAALAKSKFARPDGAVTEWAIEFNDLGLERCDWSAQGVAFPKRVHPGDKPTGCGMWADRPKADGKGVEPFCIEPIYPPSITIDRPQIQSDPVSRRCDGPGGWCWDWNQTAIIRYLWVGAPLAGGDLYCDLKKESGRWRLIGCRPGGLAI
jgi:hypothetical protein